MRRPNQKNNNNAYQPPRVLAMQTPVQSPKPTPQPEMPKINEDLKMEVEEKKEDINIEEVMDEMKKDEKNIVDLTDVPKEKQEKKKYDIDDTIIRDITLANGIHVRLISNMNGYFVDIRRYYKGYPTKRGIRILASKFALAAEYLKSDLAGLINIKDENNGK